MSTNLTSTFPIEQTSASIYIPLDQVTGNRLLKISIGSNYLVIPFIVSGNYLSITNPPTSSYVGMNMTMSYSLDKYTPYIPMGIPNYIYTYMKNDSNEFVEVDNTIINPDVPIMFTVPETISTGSNIIKLIASGCVDYSVGVNMTSYTIMEFVSGSNMLTYTLQNWNDTFQTTQFTDMVINGSTITLYGDGGLDIPNEAMSGTDCIRFISNAFVSIGVESFNGNSLLTTVDLPLCVSVGGNAFLMCSKLTTVNLPIATTIGAAIFYNCPELVTVNFPEVTAIGDYLFVGCSKLTTITLPKCTSFGSSVLDDSVVLDVTTLENITVPIALATCNNNQPDGDLQYALANNSILATNGITYI